MRRHKRHPRGDHVNFSVLKSGPLQEKIMFKCLQEILMSFFNTFFSKWIFKIGLPQLDISSGVFSNGRKIHPLLKARKGIQEDKE